MKIFQELIRCVACDSSNLSQVLDLGNQPLANDYLDSQKQHELFPLTLNFCSTCFHMQLGVAVSPERLFRDYSYVSGTSETLYDYFKWLRDQITSEFTHPGKILDIGSNDGTFLSAFNETSWRKLGVDPAANLIPMALENGVTTLPAFFNLEIADMLATDIDVVVAMNVFAHTDSPLEILLGIKRVLSKNGLAYIQTSQANILKNSQFDTVYHEHISFFNVKSMKALLARAGLSLQDVIIVPVHGESYLWKIGHDSKDISTSQREIEEVQDHLYEIESYVNFKHEAASQVARVRAAVQEFNEKGYAIASYGAAAKGNTFLNYAALELDYIFDDTPLKIGKYAPAGNCLVSDPMEMVNIAEPILFIIPAWNFKSEIIKNISRLRKGHESDMYLAYYPTFEVGEIS